MAGSKFQPNFVLLCEQLNLDTLLPILHQERLVTRDEYETVTNPAYTEKWRRGILLGLLPRKGSRYYENFSKCLVWSGQVELARHIGVDVDSIPPSPHQHLEPGVVPQTNSQDILHAIKRLISSGTEPQAAGGRAPPSSYPQQSGSGTQQPHQSLPPYNPVDVSVNPPHGPPAFNTHPPASLQDRQHPSAPPPYAGLGGALSVPATSQPSARESREQCSAGEASSQGLGSSSQPDNTNVFILYCKDALLQGSHGVSEEDFCRDVVELAHTLTCCGGITCSVDIYEKEEHPNWNLWTQKKIQESTYVVMVCSPQLIKHLSLDGERDVLMYRGIFFSSTIVNCIEAPKFIPVFLNGLEPTNLKSWLPAQLHASKRYRLHGLRKVYEQIDPDVYTEEERGLRISQCLQDPQFRELADLVRRLRKERDVVPPKSPVHPIPIPSPHNSPILPQRVQPMREGTQLAEYIPDATLQRIAEIVPGDWIHLGVKLGVEYSTCCRLKAKHGSDCESAVLEMIATWQRQKGKAATKRVLKRALMDIGFGRIAEKSFPHIKL